MRLNLAETGAAVPVLTKQTRRHGKRKSMETKNIDHGNGHKTTYKIWPSGTAYHIETPDRVCEILENARTSGNRIQIYYGDKETGRDWHEEQDTRGTIGRSSGTVKIPLLIATSRSHGGGAILDHCIIKIRNKYGLIYQHENYKQSKFEIVPYDSPEYTHNVLINGQIYSRHKSERSAKLLVKKLS